jgi:hypothetical protein
MSVVREQPDRPDQSNSPTVHRSRNLVTQERLTLRAMLCAGSLGCYRSDCQGDPRANRDAEPHRQNAVALLVVPQKKKWPLEF